MAIPNDRLEPADEPLVLFSERPAGSPQAVKVWFYPGERVGNEFVYPKTQAMAIARANHTSVLAVADNPGSNAYKSAEVGRFDERGVWQAETNTAASTTTAPKPETTTASTTGTREARTSLPRTASDLPLFALLAAFAMASGMLLRARRLA